MPSFSNRSNTRLDTCHEDLQDLFREVVKHFDCSIIEGHRTTARQNILYQSGRTSPGPILTKVDGIEKKSKHQSSPSIAVDVAPYPINWNDRERFYYFAGFVKSFALGMGIKIRWGGDWDGDTEVQDQTFMDLPHFEVDGDEMATTDSA